MSGDVLLTTTSSVEGYSILKYFDVISEEVCFNNSFISSIKHGLYDFVSSVASIFGDTEMEGTSLAILKAKEYVKEKLKERAKSIGANAVIGVDFETSFGTSQTSIRVSINGTAVFIKSIADIQNEIATKKAAEDLKIENEKKIQESKEKFNNAKTFEYELHEQIINSLKSAKEILEYVTSLHIQDSYFNDTVIPELQKMAEIERMYGNSYESAKKKLKELVL